MSQTADTIPKHPVLKPAADYYLLRREGIGLIENAGSSLWTDYNSHDPGITILEALCYAITDLAYRTGWDIKDLLSSASTVPDDPFPGQAFFTAREILTVNPWTPDDFRRLLIDLDQVRNAWVFCKECPCDTSWYAWCEKDRLTLSYRRPEGRRSKARLVSPRGLYDILLELEEDPVLGDLNDRKIEQFLTVSGAGGAAHRVTVEARFPERGFAAWDQRALFLNTGDAFANRNGESFTLALSRFGATKTYDLQTDPALDDAGRDAYVRRHWRDVFYATFDIQLSPSGKKITIENAAVRLLGNPEARSLTTMNGLHALLADTTPSGFVQHYRSKLLRVEEAVKDAKAALQEHRNLDEDYCRVKGVDIEDVAVCADVEVAPDADIELVQAKIWFAIETYLNPAVPLYTPQELMDAGDQPDAIFNGPPLKNGFIRAGDLSGAELKSVVRTSDIYNLLMDIEGVQAVNDLLLTKYDGEGKVVKGAADPAWTSGAPVFDPGKSSASWLLVISEMHQPRLYHNLSRFLFFKNGLPFLPRMDEAYDTLTQMQGASERPKIKNGADDLPVPSGAFRSPEEYFPVQYSFPLTYGTGPEGLPGRASALRRGQARQLKAYLMVFEQHLGNALAQLAHTADLFSLSPSVRRTYFVREFTDAAIRGLSDIVNGLGRPELERMTETPSEFHDRRNRFLDHLMARFGEEFREYALFLSNLQGEQVALEQLINDKISFLKEYPRISRDRGKAFNYTANPCAPENQPGLEPRIRRLLGCARSSFAWTLSGPASGVYTAGFNLVDENGHAWLIGSVRVAAADEPGAQELAFAQVTARMQVPEAYALAATVNGFQVSLTDEGGGETARTADIFATEGAARSAIDTLMLLTPLNDDAPERCIIVEHLLLRPKFPGDALYPACTDGPCLPCGEEDPYSFRLTFVMPAWIKPFDTSLEMRDFADRTIRQETPSHLLGKICWVGNDGFIEDPCDPVLGEIGTLLEAEGRTAGGTPPGHDEACACAAVLFAAFSEAFKAWYQDRMLEYFHASALAGLLEAEFTAKVDRGGIACTTVLDDALWGKVLALMVQYFRNIALDGWQFERFERAWCEWLKANAAFDWTEEHLEERVEAILAANLVQSPGLPVPPADAPCRCAAGILTAFGTAFHTWLEDSLAQGIALADLPPFSAEVTMCQGLTFGAGTAAAVRELLEERYNAYKEVSYRLRVVVNMLAGLKNSYPPATLHDCDDGGDQNPVRLGQTAIGNH